MKERFVKASMENQKLSIIMACFVCIAVCETVSSEHITSITSKTLNTTNSTTMTNLFFTKSPSPDEDQSPREKFCSKKPETLHLVGFIIWMIFIPITVVGNGIVFFVIFLSQNLRKQTTYMLLCSLAVVDAITGLSNMTLRAHMQWHNDFFCINRAACWYYNLQDVFLAVLSLLHLFVLAIDRYASLRYVYSYNRIVTRKRMMLVIALIWFLSLVITSLGVFQWKKPKELSSIYFSGVLCLTENREYFNTVFIAVLLLPMLLMVFMYSYIYRTAVRHIESITKQEVKTSSQKDKMRKKKQNRVLRSILLVFACYFICWFPFVVFTLWIFFDEKNVRENSPKLWFRLTFLILGALLPPISSSTNPFIYVLTNKQFTSSFKALLGRVIGKKFEQTNIMSMRTNTRDILSEASPRKVNKFAQNGKHNDGDTVLSNPTAVSTTSLNDRATVLGNPTAISTISLNKMSTSSVKEEIRQGHDSMHETNNNCNYSADENHEIMNHEIAVKVPELPGQDIDMVHQKDADDEKSADDACKTHNDCNENQCETLGHRDDDMREAHGNCEDSMVERL